MGKKTKSEEAVDQLDDLITGDLKKVKKTAEKPKTKGKKGVISFQVNRTLLSSALGILDQLVSFSAAMRTHVFIQGKTMTIRAAGTRRASVVFDIEESIKEDISIQPDLKTLMELAKKFSSKVISLSINTKTYQMTVKDKNIVTKLICNPVTIEPVDEIENNLADDIVTLEGSNLVIFSKATVDSKLSGAADNNYTRILVYPKSNTLCYYITNGALINGIESSLTKGDPIELNLENQEMVAVLKVMNNVKDYSSVKIRALEGSSHKFVDIESKEIRVVFNISEIDSELKIEEILHQQEDKVDESLKFVFLPYKFLDFIKKAAPIMRIDKIEDLLMIINREGKVEMQISGQSGNVIKSKYNIEKLKHFPSDMKEVKIALSTTHFSLILGHFASKPALFSCIGDMNVGGDKLVFLHHEEEEHLIGYKSLLATMDESTIKEPEVPF